MAQCGNGGDWDWRVRSKEYICSKAKLNLAISQESSPIPCHPQIKLHPARNANEAEEIQCLRGRRRTSVSLGQKSNMGYRKSYSKWEMNMVFRLAVLQRQKIILPEEKTS